MRLTNERTKRRGAPLPQAQIQGTFQAPDPKSGATSGRPTGPEARAPQVAVLTGGGDPHYALGLAGALIGQGVTFDYIASDMHDDPELRRSPFLHFFNLRKDMRSDVSAARKVVRVLLYYWHLIGYAAKARPKIFHILWNNKFAVFDRTLLMLYYRALGKRVVLTVHNVNIGWRDNNDSSLNRLTLRIQYHFCDHLFVHTEQMRRELSDYFAVPEAKVSVIPYPINNMVPSTALSGSEARQRLGLSGFHKVVLFFGWIAPYKGLEHLVDAMAVLAPKGADYRLVIAGQPRQNCQPYWEAIKRRLSSQQLDSCVTERIEFVPDADIEIYFKAADVVVLPYVYIFQSGVIFLAYNFGLPVIATDVASLRDYIAEGKTGFVCKPRDPIDLANCIGTYFSSELYTNLEMRRREIQEYGNLKHSWTIVGDITGAIYSNLLAQQPGIGREKLPADEKR